jgi:DNA mismatch repair protein MutS
MPGGGSASECITSCRGGTRWWSRRSEGRALSCPNDTVYLDCGDDRAAIITGPNMAGKSTYMRQTALIVLHGAAAAPSSRRSAVIGIGGPDLHPRRRLGRPGRRPSTFMVEMTETAGDPARRHGAEPDPLDEIGRGTSTFDGMAIARAVLEYCADKAQKLGAKTMFATHYHELTDLEGRSRA